MKLKYEKGSYGYDLSFLKKYLHPIELRRGDACVLIAPEYQGRVMTSSVAAEEGFSFGWINHKLIESGEQQEHIHAYGGEERMWLGPEGGQFSIFFAPGVPFDFEHWFTPAFLDTEGFDVTNQTETSVSFSKTTHLENYSGSVFDLEASRKVSLLNVETIQSMLGIPVPEEIKSVAFETVNQLKNIGSNDWTQESGALSIWMLGMMISSPEVTIVAPYRTGDHGPVVTDDYFGKVPADRLKVADNVIFFKADGNYRSKIGLSPSRALPIIGSYDAANKILSLLECSIDETATEYVNSAWKMQDEPFSGDVINAYNDGPVDGGIQMGPFYELESSSKAAFLKSGEKLVHVQRTYHFVGNEEQLNQLAEKKLGVSIAQIKTAF